MFSEDEIIEIGAVTMRTSRQRIVSWFGSSYNHLTHSEIG